MVIREALRVGGAVVTGSANKGTSDTSEARARRHHDIPYTLYPIPYTLYLIPYTLYPIPYTLYPMPYTLYPIPYTLRHRGVWVRHLVRTEHKEERWGKTELNMCERGGEGRW